MVCSEDGKKLSPTGIILQGSRESSERVRLDLRDVATFTLFPGQVLLNQSIFALTETV